MIQVDLRGVCLDAFPWGGSGSWLKRTETGEGLSFGIEIEGFTGHLKRAAMQVRSTDFLELVQEIIGEYSFPLTLRQIYYQLVSRQIIANEQKFYRKLSRLCVEGRNNGMLSEESFVDRLRQIDKLSSWTNLKDFMETVKQSYRRDYWTDQPCYVEIWSEKDALRSVISSVTEKYDVSLLIVRGQVSRTAIYETFKRFSQYQGKVCRLFYVGDFDPSGISIYRSLVERMNNFNGGLSIQFERIALTPDQIDRYRLPQDPAKKSDPNYKKFVKEYGDNVVELDALPPDALRNLIDICIQSCIDPGRWEAAKSTEADEVLQLQGLI